MPDPTPPTEAERLREEVLEECADIVETRSDGKRRFIGSRVAPVSAGLDALLAAVREETIAQAAPLFVAEFRQHWVRTGTAIRQEDAPLVGAQVAAALREGAP